MKLTADQLAEIKHFIRGKGYTEPDIQMELLDHLACGIEERMENSDFNKALSDTYKGFGIFGFTDFVEGINKGHKRAIRSQIRHFLMACFRLPWLLVTVLFVFLLYSSYLRYSFVPALVVIVLASGVFYWIYFRKFYRKEKRYANLAVVKTSNALSSGGLGAVIASSQIWRYFETMPGSVWGGVLSLFWTLAVLLMYLWSYTIKKYAIGRAEELEQVYGNFDEKKEC